MNNIPTLQEVEVLYTNKIKKSERIKISSSLDAEQVFRQIWNEFIEIKESSYVLLLNNANEVLGYHLLSIGGKTSTIIDITSILMIALKTNSGGILIAHNHPSGNKKPSEEDKVITKKLINACETVGLRFYDHLIVTAESYFSFLDDGMI